MDSQIEEIKKQIFHCQYDVIELQMKRVLMPLNRVFGAPMPCFNLEKFHSRLILRMTITQLMCQSLNFCIFLYTYEFV